MGPPARAHPRDEATSSRPGPGVTGHGGPERLGVAGFSTEFLHASTQPGVSFFDFIFLTESGPSHSRYIL